MDVEEHRNTFYIVYGSCLLLADIHVHLGERKSKLQCWNHFEIKTLPCVFIYWWQDCEERICLCLYAVYEIKASNNLGIFLFMFLLGFGVVFFLSACLLAFLLYKVFHVWVFTGIEDILLILS